MQLEVNQYNWSSLINSHSNSVFCKQSLSEDVLKLLVKHLKVLKSVSDYSPVGVCLSGTFMKFLYDVSMNNLQSI